MKAMGIKGRLTTSFAVVLVLAAAGSVPLMLTSPGDTIERAASAVLCVALVVGLVYVARLRTRISTSEARMDFLLYRDTMTGLPNQLLAQDRLDRLIAYSARNNAKVAALAVDIDQFCDIKESLGGQAGDAVMREVARCLHDAVRDSDTVSRQNGDTFMILLGEVRTMEAIIGVASKLLETVASPTSWGGVDISLTASMGISMWPEDGSDFDTLARKANTALVHAKRGGRNTYRFFAESMNSDSIRHLHTVSKLRRAIANQEFVLHYQPQFDIRTGQVSGAEALIRWQIPDGNMVQPDDFIPAAESSGLIVPLGEWVLHEACRQAAEWQRHSSLRPTVAVNVSAVQFSRGDLESTVLSALKSSGLDPSLLELEITESILLKDCEDIHRSIHQLGQLGIKFSIDDFGTGYSSLSYLGRFAVQKLKIDRSFIRDFRTQPGSAAIVRAIIQMARGLGMVTIAEGVEDEWALDFLREHQCEYGQGYFLGRPAPALAFQNVLDTVGVRDRVFA